MKLTEIYEHLNTISPFELQEKWDNSGLIVGDLNRDISKVVLSLDIDLELVEQSDEDTLFIVHHPLIFGNLDSLDFAKYPANILEKMVKKNQSCIALHTNFDKTHLNKYVFEKVLNFKIQSEENFICKANIDMDYNELVTLLKDKLNLSALKVIGKKSRISSIALTTGSGASLMDEVDADCFLTGDIKYHDAMKAISQDLMMVDIGHYESELFFSGILLDELKVLPLLAIITNSKNPFHIET